MLFPIIAFSFELIAIALGVILLIWGRRNSGAGTGLAKIIGLFTSLFAIVMLVYTCYYVWHYQSVQLEITKTNQTISPFNSTSPNITIPAPPILPHTSPNVQEPAVTLPPPEQPANVWRPSHV